MKVISSNIFNLNELHHVILLRVYYFLLSIQCEHFKILFPSSKKNKNNIKKILFVSSSLPTIYVIVTCLCTNFYEFIWHLNKFVRNHLYRIPFETSMREFLSKLYLEAFTILSKFLTNIIIFRNIYFQMLP